MGKGDRNRRDRDSPERMTERMRQAAGGDLSKLQAAPYDHVCPDCGAQTVQGEDGKWTLTHEATCPAGNAVDDVSAMDAQYFEDHPDADSYVRPAIALEMAGVLPPAPFGHQWMIEVTRIGPGVRSRRSFLARSL